MASITPWSFPLHNTPACRFCNWIPKYRSTVKPDNPNGNLGRPYYICIRCKSKDRRAPWVHEAGWITWDDDRGMHESNPQCDCGWVSRQDRAGVDSSRPGMGFWTCATGACGYYSKFINGQTREEARKNPSVANRSYFQPWLL